MFVLQQQVQLVGQELESRLDRQGPSVSVVPVNSVEILQDPRVPLGLMLSQPAVAVPFSAEQALLPV